MGLRVNGDVVDFQSRGTLLGLQVSGQGYVGHVNSRVARARKALVTLYRFRDLEPKLKLHLVKTLVIPILTYPPVPIHALSRHSLSRLQKVQNAALRFALNARWDEFRTSEALHLEAGLQAINARLHYMATQTWDRLEAEDWPQFRSLRALHEEAIERNHSWFPRSLLAIERNPDPVPRYK